MKSIVMTILTLAASAAAWGTVEFCKNTPDDNINYNCATYTFHSDGCFNLPQTDDEFQHPNLRYNTRFMALSSGLRCDAWAFTGCGFLQVGSYEKGSYYDITPAIASVMCHDQ